MADIYESLNSAARRTGFSVKTFRNWRAKGILPFAVYTPMGSIRVKVMDVDAWITSSRETSLNGNPANDNMQAINNINNVIKI